MKMKSLILLTAVLMLSGCTNGKSEKLEPVANAAAVDTSYQVIFVELGSDKCIPCKMMKPVMDAIETKYSGRVKVVFHDVWTEAGKPYSEKYGINVIPTQVFLDKENNEFFRHEGFFPEEEIVNLLKERGIE